MNSIRKRNNRRHKPGFPPPVFLALDFEVFAGFLAIN